MPKKEKYTVLVAGIQSQKDYGYRRFLRGETIELDPEVPLTRAFLKGRMIQSQKEAKENADAGIQMPDLSARTGKVRADKRRQRRTD